MLLDRQRDIAEISNYRWVLANDTQVTHTRACTKTKPYFYVEFEMDVDAQMSHCTRVNAVDFTIY